VGGRPLKGKEAHPVVNVSWYDAMAYCEWLSAVTRKQIALPGEAQWEKAARGTDGRKYPWGDEWDRARCNSDEFELSETTPVGILPSGASRYGCLDMAGNVWEWTRSLYKERPYGPTDGRRNLEAKGARVLRGGAFYSDRWDVRCAYRGWSQPGSGSRSSGFRVVVAPG
jgi:formylglycine-generating enzyme required for sulfatase activity